MGRFVYGMNVQGAPCTAHAVRDAIEASPC